MRRGGSSAFYHARAEIARPFTLPRCGSASALARAKTLAPTIRKLRASGITSANGIANALNEQGITTAQGKRWTARAIIAVEQRLSH